MSKAKAVTTNTEHPFDKVLSMKVKLLKAEMDYAEALRAFERAKSNEENTRNELMAIKQNISILVQTTLNNEGIKI